VLVKLSTGQTWQTTTWAAGGYQIALGAGTYTTTFSGGSLAKPVTKSFTIGTSNVAVDLNSRVDSPTRITTPPPSTVVLGSGNDTLALFVGEDAWNGDAQFTVSVDGKQIGGTQTATASHAAGQSQEFDINGTLTAGQHTATVNFLNDGWGGTPSTDRNLYVTSAKINGTTIQGGTLTEKVAGPQNLTFLIGITAPNTLTQAASASGAAGDAIPQAAGANKLPAAMELSDLPGHRLDIIHLWAGGHAVADQRAPANEQVWRHGSLGFLTDAPTRLLETVHPAMN
jgi:hypothetical protein